MLFLRLVLLVTLASNSILSLKLNPPSVLYGLFHNDGDDNHIYYGSLDLDVRQFNLLNILNVKDVGNPKNRKYSSLPMAYDPNNDIVYMGATSDQNQTILSAFNGSTGLLLEKFSSISNTIVSLQFDIFNKQLFAHLESDIGVSSSSVVEINLSDGTIKRTLATIDNAEPTDVASYCPICRKYFLMVRQNQRFVYVGIDSTDVGGISWQSPVNFQPLSMRFDYKTFTMYTASINQTNEFVSSIGILNRTIGGISEIVGTVSNDSKLFVTSIAAFDIAEKIYFSSNIFTYPYSWGISWNNITSTEVKSVPLDSISYSPYAWFVKQFIH